MNLRIYCGRLFVSALFYLFAFTNAKAQCNLPDLSTWQDINRFTYDGNWLMNNSGTGWASPTPQRSAVTTTTDDFGLNDYVGDTNFQTLGLPLPNSPVIRVGKKFNQNNGIELSPVRRAAVATFTFFPTQENCKVKVHYIGMLQELSSNNADFYAVLAANFRTDANNARRAASFGLLCTYDYNSAIPPVYLANQVPPGTYNSHTGMSEFGLSTYNGSSLAQPAYYKNYGLNDMISFYQAGSQRRSLPNSTNINRKMSGWDSYIMDFSEFIGGKVTITLYANTSNYLGDQAQNHSYCYYQFECPGSPDNLPTQLPNSQLLSISNKDFDCVVPSSTITIPINITDVMPNLLGNLTTVSPAAINNNTGLSWLHLRDVNANRYSNHFASLVMELKNGSNWIPYNNLSFKPLTDSNPTTDVNLSISTQTVPVPTPTSLVSGLYSYRFRATYVTRNYPTTIQQYEFTVTIRMATTPPVCSTVQTATIEPWVGGSQYPNNEITVCAPTTTVIDLKMAPADCPNVSISYKWQRRAVTNNISWQDIANSNTPDLIGAQNSVLLTSCATVFRRCTIITSLCGTNSLSSILPSGSEFTVRNQSFMPYSGNIDYKIYQYNGSSTVPSEQVNNIPMTSGTPSLLICYGNTITFTAHLALGDTSCGFSSGSNVSNLDIVATAGGIDLVVNYSATGFSGDSTMRDVTFSYQPVNGNGINISGASQNVTIPIKLTVTGQRDGCSFIRVINFFYLQVVPRAVGGQIAATSCSLTVNNNPTYDTVSAGGYSWQYCTQYTSASGNYTCNSTWQPIPGQEAIGLPLWAPFLMLNSNTSAPYIIKRVAQSMDSCGGAQDSNIVEIPANVNPPFSLPASFCKSEPNYTIPTTPAGSWYLITGMSPPAIAATATTQITPSTLPTGTYSYLFIPAASNTTCYNFYKWTFTIFDNPSPTLTGGVSPLATGSAMTLTPSISGGVWSSSNPAVASVTDGTVTAVAPSDTPVTISYTVTGLGGCTGTATLEVTVQNCTESTTWNGTGWSNGDPYSSLPPYKAVIFTGNYNSVTPRNLTNDIYACSLTVTNNATVVIPHIGVRFLDTTGTTVTVENEVVVSDGAILTFEDDTSLVQRKEPTTSANSGEITYTRDTPRIGRFDYTYWSSPVSMQNLLSLSPDTNLGTFYSFDPQNTGNWVYTPPGDTTMQPGKGYIIRGPSQNGTGNIGEDDPRFFPGNFKGEPNNGTISTLVYNATSNWNLIGNPYPSALDADLFLSDADNAHLNGTIYLWTHNIAIAQDNSNNLTTYQYNINSYATYNRMGGVGTGSPAGGPGSGVPTGKIAAGQGFFIEAAATGLATFKNSMRVGSQNQENSQFFRSPSVPQSAETKHRLWLYLLNVNSIPQQSKHALVGYTAPATTSTVLDRDYDAKVLEASPNEALIYSLSPGGEKLTIQGRNIGTAFDSADVVPLGIRCQKDAQTSNTIEIGLSDFDGLFTSQSVYLRELLTGGSYAYYDIKAAPHRFTITANIDTNLTRFALVFTNPVTKTATVSNDLQASLSPNPFTDGFTLNLNSLGQGTVKVQLYDLLGKLLEEGDYTVADLKNHIFGKGLPSGVYQAVLTQGDFTETIKGIKK